MTSHSAAFRIGQLVHHRLFDYRGVVIDVDPVFSGSETWYEVMARSRPPKDGPWYHVLVHDATHRTYVAERNLEADESGEPIVHPEVREHFAELRDGVYRAARAAN
ncbi:MAG: heat shock protein HspQ [Alphaproteobacteria bacterium]